MSRPLFEYITQPEKVRLSSGSKAVVLLGAISFHALVLYYLFTAKYHYKILKLPAKVQQVKLVPPLPNGVPLNVAPGTVRGAFTGGGQTATSLERGERPSPSADRTQPLPGDRPIAPSRAGSAAATAPSFTLRVPVKPGPFPSKESQSGALLGDVRQKYIPAPKDLKLYSYTLTDIWGKRPAVDSGPDAGESPGGPLGSSYGLVRSSTDSKILYRGKDSLAGQGYNLSPWAQVLIGILQKNWLLPATDAAKAWGKVGITIVVEKSGALSTVRVVNSPNDQLLVRAALDAIQRSMPLPRLPEDFPGTRLEAFLLFDYHESQ
jgi:TonB family protein